MAEITLIADTGRPTGSPAARRLRAADHVPAVVYGKASTRL
jgi:ribosomal protein L25 (general stress protein Ctc)